MNDSASQLRLLLLIAAIGLPMGILRAIVRRSRLSASTADQIKQRNKQAIVVIVMLVAVLVLVLIRNFRWFQ